MGETTGIAWTDHTWNPWWGCQRVSPGCEHCYAEAFAVKRRGLPIWGPPSTTERRLTTTTWRDPLKWDRKALDEGVRRKVFVASMADIFEDHPQVTEWRRKALDLLASLRALDVLLLTKRPQHVRAMVPAAWLDEWPAHVWVGTTVEDQRRAEERVPALLEVPARVRFLSMEPLLGPVDLRNGTANRWSVPTRHVSGVPVEWSDPGESFIPVDWVIVGGESGPGARPFDLAWARSIVRQCGDVPVFVKQMGDHPVMSAAGVDGVRLPMIAHHGADPDEWPEDLRVQQWPEVTP